MCAKWQWNARDCYWIARLAKPGVQSSNNSRVRFTVILHTLVRSRFITYMFCIHRIDMALVWWVWYGFSYIFFKIAICSIALINLGETCHLNRRNVVTVCERCCCCAVTNITACNNIMMSHGLYTYHVVTQCMNELWIFITAIRLNHPIESIKTTFMEDVSTRVLEKIKNI